MTAGERPIISTLFGDSLDNTAWFILDTIPLDVICQVDVPYCRRSIWPPSASCPRQCVPQSDGKLVRLSYLDLWCASGYFARAFLKGKPWTCPATRAPAHPDKRATTNEYWKLRAVHRTIQWIFLRITGTVVRHNPMVKAPECTQKPTAAKSPYIILLQKYISELRVLCTAEIACTRKPSNNQNHLSSYKPVENHNRGASKFLRGVRLLATTKSLKARLFLALRPFTISSTFFS